MRCATPPATKRASRMGHPAVRYFERHHEGEKAVKISAKFLLSSVFVFFTGVPIWAQDCGHGIMWNHDEQSILDDLVKRQDCLNAKFQDNDSSYLKIEIYDLQDKLKQAELDHHTAETKIEDLQASLHLIERRLAMAEDEIEWLTPKTPASKPKAPVAKPAPGFIPDTPSTTPHPASKKPDASKPKTPVNKPTPDKPTAPANNATPAVKEGTH